MMQKILYFLSMLFLIGIIYNYYPEQELPANVDVNLLVVNKPKHELLAFAHEKLLKTYKVSFGNNPVGHKEFESDEKTPEGVYFINAKNDKSGYHKNLGISYLNEQDIAHSKSIKKPTGGDIKIHALKMDLVLSMNFNVGLIGPMAVLL